METAVALDLSPCIEISIASRCYRTLVDLPITVSRPAAYLLIQYVAEIIPVFLRQHVPIVRWIKPSHGVPMHWNLHWI